MSTRNLLIMLFWVIVLGGLLIEFLAPPTGPVNVGHIQPHVFVTPNIVTPVKGHGDYLRQRRYYFEEADKHTHPGKFLATIIIENPTAHVAKNIQVHVRPYRGTDDPEGISELDTPIDDNSPMSKFGSWLDVPDLNPGQSATVTWYFENKAPYAPGDNPTPVITYTIETGEQITTPDYFGEKEAEKKRKKNVKPTVYGNLEIKRHP